MKIAIIADWLVTYGGAEHVLMSLHHMWPEAPIFTTVTNTKNLGPLAGADIRPTSLQKIYNIIGKHQPLLPLMPRAIESIDLRGYDVVISSSHAVAKGVIIPSTAKHICYCHTPMRYAWEMEDEYLDDFGIRWPLRKPIQKILSKIRRWDLSTAQRVDAFIANSSETQKRIEKTYGRESVVISPPVSERFFQVESSKFPASPASRQVPSSSQEYYLALGRMVPYKRFDLVIELANKLQLPLKIGGTGSEFDRLRKMAGPTVEFLGYVSDDELPSLYANAKAFFFPQYEDAGIVPVEAMASGTPVIAYGEGGARDVVQENVSGIFAEEQSVASFEGALRKFENIQFDAEKIRAHVRKFHEKEFQKRIIDEKLTIADK